MGEEVTLVSTVGKEKSSIVVVVSGSTNARCIEMLKVQLKRWAKRCGLSLKSVSLARRKAKKKK